MSVSRLQGLFVAVVLFLAAAMTLAGQTNVGRISGTVTDSTGSVVPGATVRATNAATQISNETTADPSGNYVFPALPSGVYRVTASHAGFRPLEQVGVVLDPAGRRSVDFALEVGQVNEAVTVNAAAQQVETESGQVGRVISGEQVSQIALNGRNYAQLLRLVPGAISTNLNPFGLQLSTTGQRINGIRTDSMYFMVDGAENMDNGGNTNAIINPNVDAIAEVKIETASYAAEFGGRSGALVNVVTKSGGRDFHGSLFEFVRNNAFDARSFFARSVDKLRFNNFGWTLGGPIFIPGKWNTGRNRFFFFASQEWKYTRQGESRVGLVPTLEERAGNFANSNLAAPIDPDTRLAFPNRVVPQSRWSKNGPALLKPYPAPNFGGPGGNHVFSGVSVTDPREDLMRFDYYISPKTQVGVRWTQDDWFILNAFQGTDLGFIPGARPRPGYVGQVTLNQTITPTMLNAFAFSVSKNSIEAAPDNSVMKRSTLGLTYPELFPANRQAVGPSVSIAGFTGYNSGDRIKNGNATIQWRDDFSLVRGRHTLKFGAFLIRARKNENTNVRDEGEVTFNTSAALSARNVIADVLLGNFQTYQETEEDAQWWARYNQFEYYAQDSFRLSKRVNLEFGVRYNYIPMFYNARGNASTFDPRRFDPAKAVQVLASNGAIVPNSGDIYNGVVILGSGWPEEAFGRLKQAGDPAFNRLFDGRPRSGVYPNKNDWGPRFGLAWDVFGNGKTAVRTGAGVFYDRISSNASNDLAGNPPFVNRSQIFDGNIDNPGGGTSRAFPSNITLLPTTLPNPRVLSYNFGVQQQLPLKAILEVNYVGNQGRHLPRTLNLNQLRVGTRLTAPNSGINAAALRPYLGYGNINFRDHADNSNYNALQVSLNRRMSTGLSFGMNYTWSKTLDSSSGTPQNSYDARPDYALSSIHRGQVLNFNYIYELPFFRKSSNALVKYTLARWEVAGVTSFQSGAPGNVSIPSDVARIGVGSSRASVIGNPILPKSERTLARYYAAEMFLPADRMVQGQFGNAGRNIVTGPGFQLWDISLAKNVDIRERARLQFRAEAFNFPNHANFTSINTTAQFDSAGRPTQNFGAINGAGPGRILSFGLKLLF